MADSSDLAKLGTPEGAAPTALNLVRAVVHSIEGSTLKVIVPSFDDQRLYEIENKDWRADSDAEVLIALDDDDQPWLAIPGWPFRGGGLLAALRADSEAPNPDDVMIGDGIRGIEPGAEGAQAMRWAMRIGGFYKNAKSLRSAFQSAMRGVESDDPVEVFLGRIAGVNKAVPTGSGIYDRKHPPGKSTVVAVDAAPGASTLYIVDGGYGIPGKWDPADVLDSLGVPQVEYLIDSDQSIAWTSKTSLVATISGDAEIGDTELRIAEPTLTFPDAGKAFMSRGGVLPQWTGRELVLDANADGPVMAGATTIPLKNVTQQEADDLDPAGTVRAAAGNTGADIRRWKYDSFTYDPGTQTAIFTFPPTEVNRNLLDNASITIAKLTGITSEFQMPTLGDRKAGDRTLRLKFNHKHGDPPIPPTQELIDKIRPSGMLRVEVEDDDPAGPGLVDFPVERLAYSDFDPKTGEITLAEELPEDVPDDSWVWIEGCVGMMRAHVNGTQIRMGRLNGVTGLNDGASVNEIAQWIPRYRNPGTIGSIGFAAATLGGVAGLTNKNAQIAFRALEDSIKANRRGGEVDIMVVVPGMGHRKAVLAITSKGLALLGGGLTGSAGTAYRLHVADWGCRTKPPGIVFECDPDDPDCDPDDPGGGGGGEIGSATLGVDHVEGVKPAARIVLPGYNRMTGEIEPELELDYTGTNVDAADQATLTGITLASVTGFALGDYFFDAGTHVRYADSVRSSATASKTGTTWDEGRPTQGYAGVGVGANGEPGFEIGLTEPLRFYKGADGKWKVKHDTSAETTVQTTDEKGEPNGYASLDAGGRLPNSQLPASAQEFIGPWDASTNTPTLADGVGSPGDFYRVTVAGTQDLGSGPLTFQSGDGIQYDGAVWFKLDNTDEVSSVNGQTGIVVLRLDQLDAPTADVGLNSRKITSLGDASAATDALNRQTGDARYLALTQDALGTIWRPHGERLAPPASTAAGVTNRLRYCVIVVPQKCVVTGLRYKVGGVSLGSVNCTLYDSTGTQVAVPLQTPQAAINTRQEVPFNAPVTIGPGVYLALIRFTGSGSTCFCWAAADFLGAAGEGSGSVPATLALPTGLTIVPVPSVTLY